MRLHSGNDTFRNAALFYVGMVVLGSLLMITYSTVDGGAQPKVYKIRDRGPGGGIVFYDRGKYSDGWRYLEAAPEYQGRAPWGCEGTSIPQARGTAVGAGKANTMAIIKACGDADTAAKRASEYRGGDKDDWYLPSRDEMFSLYSRQIYLDGENVWTSTENSASDALTKIFGPGLPGVLSFKKSISCQVRAIRAF